LIHLPYHRKEKGKRSSIRASPGKKEKGKKKESAFGLLISPPWRKERGKHLEISAIEKKKRRGKGE